MHGHNDTRERCCCGTSSQRKHVERNCLEASYCTGERPCDPRKFGKCQCAIEASWESHSPPRPRRDWASNFSELRRRWSEHAKRQNCPCDNCKRKSIQPLEDTRKTCQYKEHFDNEEEVEDEDPGYRSSSNRGCSRDSRPRRRSPGSRCKKSSRSNSASVATKDCRSNDIKLEDYCLCQPQRRDCCSRLVRIDARSQPECTCECPTTVECPCPPSERHFLRSTKCCVLAKSCGPRNERRDERKTNCSEIKSKPSYERNVKIPSRGSCCKWNSCGTSPGRDIVSLISFALLILIAVAWTLNRLLQSLPPSSSSRPRVRYRSKCCDDHSTCLSMVQRTGCRGDNSTAGQQRHRRQHCATWERTTTKRGEECLTVDDRPCGADCRPIVHERGELLIIEDLPQVCDNECAYCQLHKVTSHNFRKQSRHRSRTRTPKKLCNVQGACTCAMKSMTNCATQVSRRKLTLKKIAHCDYTVDRRKCSSKEIQVGGRGIDACVGCERTREDAVKNKSSERLKRTKARNNLNDARVKQISKIDLRCSKYITSSADKKKKEKRCKCPPTCKYYVGPKKAASDVHQYLLSKSRKSKKRDKKY